MLKALVSSLLLLFIFSDIEASSNVVYVSIDGMSRHTFYALLNKQQLPHFQEIIDRGNYRNMEIKGYSPNTFACFTSMLSGYGYHNDGQEDIKIPISVNTSIFGVIKKQRPKITTVSLINHPIGVENRPSLNELLLHEQANIDILYEEKVRSSSEISKEVASTILSISTPFFLFTNFTNVDFMGRKYREGADMYSLSIKRCDKALGVIIQSLKNRGVWDSTHFVLTTSYGYRPKSRFQSEEIWIASTEKIRFKGTQLDIVPTIYRLLGINSRTIQPLLPGTSLVDL